MFFDFETLYIHTQLYDVVVNRPRFISLDIKLNEDKKRKQMMAMPRFLCSGTYSSRLPATLPERDFNTLDAIYCYEDGTVRFGFCNLAIKEKTVLEEKMEEGFEENLNEIIKTYFQKAR